jgi:hypothetical protein
MVMGSVVSVLRPPGSAARLRRVAAGVIEAARRRQNLRHRRATTATLAALALALAAYATASGPGRPGPPPSATRPITLTPAASVLAKAPYMGVSCPLANSIACDRVGLALWLRHPATSVTATIAGRPLNLDDPTWAPGHPRHGARTAFTGFLQPAGIVSNLHVNTDNGGDRWTGIKFPTPPLVRLRIVYPSGKTITTQLRVDLAPGWG